MISLRARVAPRSAFATPFKGDTLFGQLCWALRNRGGEQHLIDLLEDYTQGKPCLVVSDAFPSGFVPLPTLPGHHYEAVPGEDRKSIKRRRWVPLTRFSEPITQFLVHAQPTATTQVAGRSTVRSSRAHNTLNRLSGTTGTGAFAPYSVEQEWFTAGADSPGGSVELDIYIVLDEARLGIDDLHQALSDVGCIGFGRDASIGLGKFDLLELTACDYPSQSRSNAWLTLAPSAPQGLAWIQAQCHYRIFVRFGRHGDRAVQLGKPFKTPVLLADTAAVFMPRRFEPALFCGQGLGGFGRLSNVIAGTVQQGYAPVLCVHVPEPMGLA